MIKTILWDVDGTLLSFREAERAAILACFESRGLGVCTEEMVRRYSRLNARYWERLELGELTKPQVLRGRFVEFFAAEGIEADPDAFNAEYQLRLGDTICYIDDSYELVKRLRGRVRQYAVTNGTVTAQEKKLARSGFDRLLDGVFISDRVGVEKPGKVFFDRVFDAVGPCDPAETMIVGDSLTSDMQGGMNAGIVTCWYNPRGLPNDRGVRVDHEIRDLREVEALLDEYPYQTDMFVGNDGGSPENARIIRESAD